MEEEDVANDSGQPVTKIVGDEPSAGNRKPGLLAGQITIKPGFDELPADFDDEQ